MNRIPEQNKRGPNTMQAWRQHEPTEFYQKAQKAKDQEWLRLATEQLRVTRPGP